MSISTVSQAKAISPNTLLRQAEEWAAAHTTLREQQHSLGREIDNSHDYWKGDDGDAMREHFGHVGRVISQAIAAFEDAEAEARRWYPTVSSAHSYALRAIGAAESRGYQLEENGTARPSPMHKQYVAGLDQQQRQPTIAKIKQSAEIHTDRITSALDGLGEALDASASKIAAAFADLPRPATALPDSRPAAPSAHLSPVSDTEAHEPATSSGTDHADQPAEQPISPIPDATDSDTAPPMPIAAVPFGVQWPADIAVTRRVAIRPSNAAPRPASSAPPSRRQAKIDSPQRHDTTQAVASESTDASRVAGNWPPATTTEPQERTPIARAVAILTDLVAQSVTHPGVDWAVGVYERDGKVEYFAVSNEATGFLPVGLKWNASVRHVFDPHAPLTDVPQWRGLANPARIIADHFVLLRTHNSSIRLLAIGASCMPGSAVTELVARNNALLVSQLTAAQVGDPVPRIRVPGRWLSRLESVEPEIYRQITEDISSDQAQSLGVHLAADAVAKSGLNRAYPDLKRIATDPHHGSDAADVAARLAGAYRDLTALAQCARVPDERLGSLGDEEYTSIGPIGGAGTYAVPFWRARACAILTVLLEVESAQKTLSLEQLADIAYEHYCITDDSAATGEFLIGQSNSIRSG